MVTNCSVDELTQPAETTAECIAAKLAKFNKKYKPDQHSNKGICGLQVKTWCSEVYTHFVMPPAIMMMDSGDISYQFICKLGLCSCMDESTSNLICHVNTCSPSTSSASTPSISNYSVGQFQYLVATWSACRV